MAMSGAHGLLAIAITAVPRLVRSTGSNRSELGGIGGGPSGRPFTTLDRVKSTFGFSATLLPEFSGAPAAIHLWIRSRLSLAILGDFGGMYGSCRWFASR